MLSKEQLDAQYTLAELLKDEAVRQEMFSFNRRSDEALNYNETNVLDYDPNRSPKDVLEDYFKLVENEFKERLSKAQLERWNKLPQKKKDKIMKGKIYR